MIHEGYPATFDRFDICEAWYVYAYLYHEGQWSKEYQIFGRLINMQFKPKPNLNPGSLTFNGKMIFRNLVRNKGKFINKKII